MLLGIFLPLFNFFLIAFFGRFISQKGAVVVTLFNFLLILIFNFYNFVVVLYYNTAFYFNIGAWIQFGLIDISWEFMLDFLAVSMLLMVSIISSLVHLYSFSYMGGDPHFSRFISYLSLFTFFMFLIVSSANLVVLFVGWEGVGLCSYLLINFWYTRVQANKAALKALLMNRIGDLGYLLGIVLVFAVFRTFDFSTLEALVPYLVLQEGALLFMNTPWGAISYMDIICISFFIGVVGKSAQIGLHTWLPAAMEGPTPVSALIHAATMVTAGIFLLIRCAFLFDCSFFVKTCVVIFGAATAFFSAFTAIFLYDIKRIIAYSTCSQLGYMAVACGLSQYNLGLFHLINHAFFKALLFLTAGAIIHSLQNEQDIRKLSNLTYRTPFLHSCLLVGTIAIMGLPFLSGYYSKELIIEVVFLKTNYIWNGSFIVYFFIMAATACTAIYSLRLYYYLFLRAGTQQKTFSQIKVLQQPLFILLPLSGLMVGSIFSGYFLNDVFLANNLWSVDNYIVEAPGYSYIMAFENEFLPWFIKLLPFFINFFILIVSFLFIKNYQKAIPGSTLVHSLVMSMQVKVAGHVSNYESNTKFFFIGLVLKKKFFKLAHVAHFNFYFNEVYNLFVFNHLNYYFTNIFLNFDKGVLELVGPTGLSRLYRKLTKMMKQFYRLGLSSHLLHIYTGLLVLFSWLSVFIM